MTAGTELVTRLRDLRQPPRLVVLVSCQSAGAGAGDALDALGPRLGEAGVPAVLAMHGNVTMQTADAFMPSFFGNCKRTVRSIVPSRGHAARCGIVMMPGRLFSNALEERESLVRAELRR